MEKTLQSESIDPSFGEMVRVFGKIGLISFGGPAGQIALMHGELVAKRGWISEAHFLHALNFCNLLPGPEAQQLATYIGWKLRGVGGGLVAGLLFIIPGALVMLALSILYAYAARLDWFAALFLGIKAAVLAIVLQALLRIAQRALKTRLHQALALLSFVALAGFALPFPLLVLGAGLIGFGAAQWRPDWLALVTPARQKLAPRGALVVQTLRTLLLWGSIWAAPLLLVALTLGRDHVLWQIGLFFSQLAIVTFGGAYAVLSYMAQQAVTGFGWLSAGEMADGLGLAETTPGPLILVTQFVGYIAAFRAPAPFAPLLAGMLGAALTLWVTFVPCFLWIFGFAPWIERLRDATRLQGALTAITASIVGVIANLALWFGLHLLFARSQTFALGAIQFALPELASLDLRAALLALFAALLLFVWRRNILVVLALVALAGLVSDRVFG